MEAKRRTVSLRPSQGLCDLLGKIFDDSRSGERKVLGAEEYNRRRHDFIFHMTDWLNDLHRLTALYKNPAKQDPDDAGTEVIGFLYHVIPHLNAAGRLLLDEVGDPFADDPVVTSKTRPIKSPPNRTRKDHA
jgi:hypothetical protein